MCVWSAVVQAVLQYQSSYVVESSLPYMHVSRCYMYVHSGQATATLANALPIAPPLL